MLTKVVIAARMIMAVIMTVAWLMVSRVPNDKKARIRRRIATADRVEH